VNIGFAHASISKCRYQTCGRLEIVDDSRAQSHPESKKDLHRQSLSEYGFARVATWHEHPCVDFFCKIDDVYFVELFRQAIFRIVGSVCTNYEGC
jgi:hypothetical protein